MLPRRTHTSKDLERMALTAIVRLLRGVLGSRRKTPLILLCALAFGLAAPAAEAHHLTGDALLASLDRLDLQSLSPSQRKSLAAAARRTRDARLAARTVDALCQAGGRDVLPILDAIAGGKTRVPAVEAQSVSTRALWAAADVRLRVVDEMIRTHVQPNA